MGKGSFALLHPNGSDEICEMLSVEERLSVSTAFGCLITFAKDRIESTDTATKANMLKQHVTKWGGL